MKTRKLILLTEDSALESVARDVATLAGFDLVVGRTPQDGVRLFTGSLASLSAVMIDLDSCKHGAAWLTAMTPLSGKIPAVAISRLDPEFLRPLARRHGVDHWLAKPVSAEGFATALQILSLTERVDSEPEPETEETKRAGSREFILCDDTVKGRQFSLYSGTGEQCILKEEGADRGRRLGGISEGTDLILGLDCPLQSTLTVYNSAGMVFTITV